MQSYNSIQLLGHVGQAPEIHQFPNGGRKGTLKIATNSGSGDNKKTHWHTLIFYNNAADLISRLQAGDAIFAEGSLEYRSWTDQHGQNRTSPEINVSQFSILKGEVGQVQVAQNQANNQNYNQGNGQRQGYANQGQGYGNKGQRQGQGYNNQGKGQHQNQGNGQRQGYANQGYNQGSPNHPAFEDVPMPHDLPY